MGWKLAGLLVLYTGSIAMPALWWIVALRWANEEHAGLPLRGEGWTWLPLAFAFVMWVVMATNPLHGAFMTPVLGGRNVYQPFWYIMAIPNYCLILAALAVEIEVARRVARSYVRRQAAFLVAASLVTLVGNALYVSNVVPLNLSPLVLAASGALLLVGMAREGLFGVLPSALPAIAEDHPDGLVIVGPEGHVRLANGRAHALLAPVDLPAHALFAETPRDERLRPAASSDIEAAARDPWDALTRSGGVLYRVELERPRWLLLSASPVTGPRGGTRGYRVHISDLTSQKDAELQEHQTRRLESVADLTRTLSRQFQGAFAIVHANAEMLQDDPRDGPASERKLTRILEAAKYGSSVAQDLQLYTGSVNTRRVLLELSEVVEEGCDLVESELPPAVRLSFARADGLLPVYVDAIQLRHCIFNVLTNAIEAMAERAGEIRVSTGAMRIDPSAALLVWGSDEPKGDFAYVRIGDEGGGMDAATEERAFEPFFSSRHKDRGNGLSTVLGIARAHGALVELENEPGQGCEFTLYFPLERNAGSA